MGCNCEPKKYSISMGCCQPVLGPVENYYTKYQIDEMLEEIESAITSGCCITPEQVDEKIEEAISGITPCDLSDYYTKEQVDAKIPSLSGYATEQWVENKGYINQIKTINGQSLIGTGDIEIGTGGTIDLSNYYTTAETKNLVESAVTVVEGEIPSLSGYATEQWVLDKHYISGVDLSDYATHQWVEDKHYITGVDLSDYALKSEIPVVPTSNTAFTNDAGYLTEHQSLSAYSTTNEVNTLINQSVSGKADTTTVNNITSALTAHTADTTIHVTQTEKNTWNSKVDSSTLNNYMLKTQIWCGTQAQYDAITTKDNSVIYLIHE